MASPQVKEKENVLFSNGDSLSGEEANVCKSLRTKQMIESSFP